MTRQQLPPQIKKLTVTDRTTGKPVVRYQVTVDVGANPATGKRRQVRRRFATEKQARDGLARLGGQVVSSEFVARNAVTVEQVCADWLGSLHWARATTLAGYAYNLAPLREQYGSLLVQQLTRKHIDDLVRLLAAGGSVTAMGRKRRPWAPRSLNRTVELTTMVLKYARARKLVADIATDGMKSIPKGQRKHNTYTPSEVKTLLASVANDRNGHLWLLALCGLRRGEICGLRWSAVDFDSKTLTVEIGRSSAGGKAVENDPKTGAAIRTLPLDAGMVAALKKAQARQHREKNERGDAYGAGEYVASNELGHPYHPDSLNPKWAKAVKRAGVRHIRLHDCRHTAGTTMHLRKVPMAVIAAWLGHADASVTAKIYAHSQNDALAEALQRLGEVVTSRDTGTSLGTSAATPEDEEKPGQDANLEWSR